MKEDKGIDPQTGGIRGRTPLHEAVQDIDFNAVSELLASGIDVDGRDARRLTPLHLAAMEWDEILPIMVKLVISGADIDARDINWQSPIMIAAQFSFLGGVIFLLGAGARLDFKNRRGMTALDLANYTLEGIAGNKKYADQQEAAELLIEVLTVMTQDRLTRIGKGSLRT